MHPIPTIQQFDAFLAARGLSLEAVVIGGSALALLGVVERETRDVDVMHPHVPPAVSNAARAFAAEERSAGRPLSDGWLNNGPESLARELPSGWQGRTQRAFAGVALTLVTLGRADLLKSKLYALCDRGTDVLDCVALAPTSAELDEALPWVSERDGNELWPEHVRLTLDDLRRRLGHAV
jgi:hypothetical protein